TPNMDQLAAEGIRFKQAYATPLCTNTRIQLMTGRYNNRNWKAFGIFDPDEKTFGHHMQEAGYVTAIAGKWQLHSYDPVDWPGAELRRSTGLRAEDSGFDHYSLWHTGHTEDKGSRYADPVIYEDGAFRTDTNDHYGPDLWVEYLCEFMESASVGEKPFFAYYSMALPHNPFEPTPDSPEWGNRELRRVEETRYYKDMVEYTDKLLGRLVGKIDDLGIRENTVILFYSDNGTNQKVLSKMGEQLVHGGKGTPGDLGVRVPFIASWKGKSGEGVTNDDLIDSTDFLPTLLDAGGKAEVAEEMSMDGRSFLPQLRGETGNPRDWIYVHQEARPGWDKDQFPLIRFARNKRFKLYDDGRLYEPGSDLYEESPVLPESDSGETAKARRALQEVLDSMKPYPIYDPSEMPRPNKMAEALDSFSFQEVAGVVVMEAERVGIPSDGSWLRENLIGGHRGGGYVRALRDQDEKPEKGILKFDVNLKTAGEWILRVRHRHDHAGPSEQDEFWVRANGGDWIPTRSADSETARGWEWDDGSSRQGKALAWKFGEGIQRIEIAPRHDQVKIDRLVLYQAHRESRALDKKAPESPFHPWVNKYIK
ncbi:MAG: sulfatase-like hydrolase/transferase, partial [Verrucomicrobiota bacterium]